MKALRWAADAARAVAFYACAFALAVALACEGRQWDGGPLD